MSSQQFHGQQAGYHGYQPGQSYHPPPPQQHYQQPGYDYNQHYQKNSGYQPGYSQGYPPPQPPPPQADPYGYQPPAPPPQGDPYGYQPPAPPPPGHDSEKYNFDQAFKVEKPKWNDIWAAVLFILFFLGFAAVSGISIHGYVKASSGGGIYGDQATFALNSNTIILFAFVLLIAVVLSYGYVWLARLFPKQFIWATGILNVAFAIGLAIYFFYRRSWGGAIVFLLFGLLLAFCFYTWIPRIPFSALMLRTAIDVAKRYGHVYLVSWLGGLLGAAFAAWYAVTLVAVYHRFQPDPRNPNCADGSCSSARVTGLIVFVTFTMYWVSEVIKNVIHTAISGVYGAWYFCANNFPHAATRGALKRAMTYSFGSICFGSLVVAIINFLRHICSVARSQAASEGDLISWVLFCVLSCILAIVDWAVTFLNRYAFSHIALYGKAYLPAAKDTWAMIKDRGIDALINDCLIGPVLSFGAAFVGYASALFAYLFVTFTDPPYNQGGDYTAVIIAFSFLIGLQIANIFTTPISSGIDTIFVAAAWDPEVMIRDHPELYHEMVRVYPQVQQAIHA